MNLSTTVVFTILLFVIFIDNAYCKNESFVLEVTVDGSAENWKTHLEEYSVDSCYLEGDIRGGSTINIETNQVVKIGYVSQNKILIVETWPGLCDGGTEVRLTKKDGLYQGTLLSRSFSGYKELGSVVEVKK